MANFLYPSIKNRMLTGQFDWTTDNVVVILIATGLYVPSVNHATLLDIPVSARVATSSILTGKTVNINVVDADDCQFPYVAGPPVNSVVLVVAGAGDASSYLICYLDEAVIGLPFTPSLAPASLIWDNGPSRIFSL